MADMYEEAAGRIIQAAQMHGITMNTMDSYDPDLRDGFLSKFSPDKIEAMPGDKLLRSMFTGTGSMDNMSYWLLYKTKKGFGNLGGYPLQFGLYYRKGLGWTPNSYIAISKNDALEKGKEIQSKLIRCGYSTQARIELNCLESLEDYAKLQGEMDILASKYFGEQAWVRKYLYMVYPEYFVSWYKEEYMDSILKKLKIHPAGSVYGKIWQMLALEKAVASQLGTDRVKEEGRIASLCWTVWSRKML